MITEEVIAKFVAAGASAPLITKLRDCVHEQLQGGLGSMSNTDFGFADVEEIAGLLKPRELPIPGVVEKEVPGEVKREALAQEAARAAEVEARKKALRISTEQLVTERKLSAAEELARAQHEKRNNNFRKFIQHMAAIDPFSTERMADVLSHARTPVRYQAWGHLGRNIALWSSATCGGDLADLNKEFCSAPDRIELIDRIGFYPEIMPASAHERITEINAIELQVHGLENKNTSHPAYELLCRSHGLRLYGAGRPVILPRASVPLLRLNCDVPGWLFVEGWRVSLG